MLGIRKWIIVGVAVVSLFAVSVLHDARDRTAKADPRPAYTPDVVASWLRGGHESYGQLADRLGVGQSLRIYANGSHPKLAGRWQAEQRDNGVNVDVLLLTDATRSDWQDLVFQQTKDGTWTFVGAWNMAKQSGGRPTHRLVVTGPGRYALAVRYRAVPTLDCGELQQESWLEPASVGGLHEAIRFPANASGCSRALVAGYGTRYRLTDYREWSVDQVQHLELRYTVMHYDSPSTGAPVGRPIFAHTVLVQYSWNRATSTFEPDPNSSDTLATNTSEQLRLDPDRFIREHASELARIAGSGNRQQLIWLHGVLEMAQASEAKDQIRKAMDVPPAVDGTK